MPIATIMAIMGAVETVIQQTPEAIALFNAAKAALSGGTDPTSEQWSTLMTAMAAAHAKVQVA
jgi:hypothetical protein